jgi:hypothetical protein
MTVLINFFIALVSCVGSVIRIIIKNRIAT